ncbi:MAG: HPP family protein [Candidatus Micrarchaeota archaeon]|nr:HPP family protein [Candidatus Micrarchaeota archaeon]
MKLFEDFDHALYRRARHKQNRKHILIPTVITTFALLILIAALEGVNLDLRNNVGYSAIIFTSFASSAFILFITPYARSSSVRRFISSYAIGAVFGEIGYLLTNIVGFYVAAAVVVFCVAILLFETDNAHPPAIGLAFAFVIFQVDYAGLLVVVAGVAVLALIKLAIEKLGVNP